MSASIALVAGLAAGCGNVNESGGAGGADVAGEKPDYDQEVAKGCPTYYSLCGFDLALNGSICCAPGQTCVKDPDGNYCDGDPTPYASGLITPNYSVLALMYAAPGKLSEVDYQSGSTAGSHTETKKAWAVGAKVSLGIDAGVQADISAQFTAGKVSGTSAETRKEVGFGIGLTAAPGRLNDDPACDEDTFYLWLKPQMSAQEGPYNVYSVKLAPIQQTKVSFVSVRELRHPELLAGTPKGTLLNDILTSTAARNSLLSIDPCTTNASLDVLRYYKTTQLLLQGAAPGAATPYTTFFVNNESVKGVIQGKTVDVDVEALFGAGIGKALSLQAGPVFHFGYENTQETTTGESQAASIKFQTDTVGYSQVWDIYYDSVFRTFTFRKYVPPAGAAAVSGTLLNDAGAPVANEQIQITLPGGLTRGVMTDAQGHYESGPLPQGTIEIVARDRSRTIELGSEAIEGVELAIPAR